MRTESTERTHRESDEECDAHDPYSVGWATPGVEW